MRKNNFIISVFLILTLVFFPFSQKVCAEETQQWKVYLKEFLVADFPSLFDENTIKKNEKVFEKYNQWWFYERPDTENPISDSDVSSDVLIYNIDIPNIYLPWGCEFYDLDSDGIPEAVIIYAPLIAHGGAWGEVYKLYGTSYEKIGSLSYGEYSEYLYINPQNRIVSFKTNSTEFLDIINHEIVYSEYLDSDGNKEYKGIKYSEIGSYSYEHYGFTQEEILGGLKNLPQIDCSDILNEITPVNSPQTDDVSDVLLLTISAAFVVTSIGLYNHHKRRKYLDS